MTILAALLALRASLLSTSQWYGQEYLIAYFALLYFWVIFRTGLFEVTMGEARWTRLDVTTVGLTVFVVACVAFGSPV